MAQGDYPTLEAKHRKVESPAKASVPLRPEDEEHTDINLPEYSLFLNGRNVSDSLRRGI